MRPLVSLYSLTQADLVAGRARYAAGYDMWNRIAHERLVKERRYRAGQKRIEAWKRRQREVV